MTDRNKDNTLDDVLKIVTRTESAVEAQGLRLVRIEKMVGGEIHTPDDAPSLSARVSKLETSDGARAQKEHEGKSVFMASLHAGKTSAVALNDAIKAGAPDDAEVTRIMESGQTKRALIAAMPYIFTAIVGLGATMGIRGCPAPTAPAPAIESVAKP